MSLFAVRLFGTGAMPTGIDHGRPSLLPAAI